MGLVYVCACFKSLLAGSGSVGCFSETKVPPAQKALLIYTLNIRALLLEITEVRTWAYLKRLPRASASART